MPCFVSLEKNLRDSFLIKTFSLKQLKIYMTWKSQLLSKFEVI